MAAPEGLVQVRSNGSEVVFRVEGWGTMAHGLPLRRLAERELAEGPRTFRVDLRHCTYMDSTFMGTLLFLKHAIDRQGSGAFWLVSPSSECRHLLQQMGLTEDFSIEDGEELSPEGWLELTQVLPVEPGFKENVVDAHCELASVPGPAAEQFRTVARCLTEAMEAEKAEGSEIAD